ncbi:MAG: HNH endonuclease, partial [Bifidobacteriaceae bacterium]|nr:HNH endonuclease [Bifidobacteriaceae bacterium]
TYTPPDSLAELVRVRDQTCRWPGCTVPAADAEIDHIVPFSRHRPAALQTTAANLQTLCKAHHLAKHNDGWTVQRDSTTGITTWTAPGGRQHHVPPATINLTTNT